jgi:fructose-1,6-bisphosphatase/inositol monophosphatase family enzyme
MTPIDIETIARILEQTAQEEILPRFRALADEDIREKQGGELVTVADEAAERTLTRRLRDALPGSHVVGEEAVAGNPAILEQLAREDWVWVIDPVDGTGNFAAGRAAFATMIGLLHDGRTVAAWIHEPVAGRTAMAERGAGAMLGGRRVSLVRPPRPDPAKLSGTLHASSFAPPEMARRVQRRRHRVNAVKSLRCAGLEYLRLLSGEMQFSLFTRLMPWDHVPGTLIHAEAGGTSRTLDGRPYEARSYRAKGLLIAPDGRSWERLHAALFDDAPPGLVGRK